MQNEEQNPSRFIILHLLINPYSDFDDSTSMFPMSALLSHAELTKRKTSNKQAAEGRRAVRFNRHGNLTLFPRVERGQPIERPTGRTAESQEEPTVVASISNVSTTGVGLILSEELPNGLEFDVQWPQSKFPVPLRFEVVHSQQVSAGLYRTGARLVAGVLPAEPMPLNYINQEQPDETDSNETATIAFIGGVLNFEPDMPSPESDQASPTPPGTLRAASAFGFDKTEKIDGITTCGWERSISLRREGSRLWIYIHSPGKKNGWGIYVNPEEFESALDRVQQSASSPFITTLAA